MIFDRTKRISRTKHGDLPLVLCLSMPPTPLMEEQNDHSAKAHHSEWTDAMDSADLGDAVPHLNDLSRSRECVTIEPSTGNSNDVFENSDVMNLMCLGGTSALLTASKKSKFVLKLGRISDVELEKEVVKRIKEYNKNAHPQDRINAVDYMRCLNSSERKKARTFLTKKMNQKGDNKLRKTIMMHARELQELYPGITDQDVIRKTVEDGCVVMKKYHETLFDLVKRRRKCDGQKFEEMKLEATKIAIKFLDAVIKLKRLNIIHGDLKLENVMLTRDNEIVIIDFGSSSILKEGEKTSKKWPIGTETYESYPIMYARMHGPIPEYDHMVDVYPAYRVVAALLNLYTTHKKKKNVMTLITKQLYNANLPYLGYVEQEELFKDILSAFACAKPPENKPNRAEEMLRGLKERLERSLEENKRIREDERSVEWPVERRGQKRILDDAWQGNKRIREDYDSF